MSFTDEELKSNLELWEKIQSIKPNIDCLLSFNLIKMEEINRLKVEKLTSYSLKPWEFEVGEEYGVSVETRKIVGTAHPNYKNKSLYDAFNSLKRGDSIVYNYVISPEYYNNMDLRELHREKLHITYKKHEDKYYISGDGNHRFILSKVLNINNLIVENVTIYNEDLQLKKLLQQLESLNFTYTITSDLIKIKSEFVELYLNGEVKSMLSLFINNYFNLNTSKLSEYLYKFKLNFMQNFRRKYAYSNDEIKHLMHYHFLKLIEHKRNYAQE